MWPRIAVFIHPTGKEDGQYRVRVLKGWWAGPGTGGANRVLGEFHLDLRHESEEERLAQALRAAADEITGWSRSSRP